MTYYVEAQDKSLDAKEAFDSNRVLGVRRCPSLTGGLPLTQSEHMPAYGLPMSLTQRNTLIRSPAPPSRLPHHYISRDWSKVWERKHASKGAAAGARTSASQVS